MAHVPINSKLLNDIASKVRELCNRELNALPAVPRPTIDPEEYPDVLNYIWDGRPELRTIIPRQWGRFVNRMHVEVRFAYEAPVPARPTETHEAFYREVIEVQFNKDTFAAPTFSSWENKRFFNNGYIPYLSDYIDAQLNRREISARWDYVKDNLMTFLNSCRSLKEALFLQPEIRTFIPQWALDKMEETTTKKTREQRVQEIPKLDVESLQAPVVSVRLSEANNKEGL